MVDITSDKIDELLSKLSGLRIKEAVSLRNRLTKEKKRIEKQTTPDNSIDKETVNQKRSRKMERYWRYIKLVRDNFPNLKTKQIRTELKKRKQGQPSEIPDAIWQNPSG